MIKPLPGYVLLQPIEEEEKSAGGVYLPETSKDKPMKGKVIALSSQRDLRPKVALDWNVDGKPLIKKGQTVIFKKWTNQEVKHEGKEYLLVHFNELLGVIDGE